MNFAPKNYDKVPESKPLRSNRKLLYKKLDPVQNTLVEPTKIETIPPGLKLLLSKSGLAAALHRRQHRAKGPL